MMSYQMFIDDERFPTVPSEWIVARTMDEVVRVLEHQGPPSAITFDHDLGEGCPTGRDIAGFLVEEDMDWRATGVNRTGFFFQPGFRYWVHSMNPVGAENIRGLLDNYLRFIV